MPKLKKKSLKRLKALAWQAFSSYIRRKGSWGGRNKCVTCGAIKSVKELNAGHFLHGVTRATYLDEENVHCQCIRCNMYLSGNLIPYYEFMLKTYGQEKIDELKRLSKQVWKPTRQDLEAIIEKYK